MTTGTAAGEAPAGGFRPEYFEQLAALEAGNFWFRARNRLIVWARARYFPKAGSMFEVGCGTGFVLAGLAEADPRLRLIGSEIFAEGLAVAAVRVPQATLVRMDARRIALAESVDVIGAFDVIEHIVEDERVLGEMFAALRPGGGLLITVPQHMSLWSPQDDHAQHVRRYSAAELRRKLQAAGFEIVRTTSFVSLLLPLMWASRRRKRRAAEVDPLDELKIHPVVNAVLQKVLEFELALIRIGIDWPAGGSLLAVATKPGRER